MNYNQRHTSSPLIRVQSLYKEYQVGRAIIPVLAGIDLSIKSGEFLSIMGPSGSGKSTLMNILGFLDAPSSGKYCFGGQDVSHLTINQQASLRNLKIGFVFQRFNLLSQLSALENVELPLIYRNGKSERHQASLDALNTVGLSNRALHRPTELSGGEQQRVAVARAIVNRPDIILADEPTGNLDSRTSREIMAVFGELNKKQGITVALVTHDAEIANFTDRRILLRDGLIQSDEFLAKERGHAKNLIQNSPQIPA
jgi:putative ABC transport system ATP-binding protein